MAGTRCLSEILDLLIGALTSECFWGLNLALLLVLACPVGYIYLLFLSPPGIRPFLVLGIVVAAGIAQGLKDYFT